MDADSVRIGFVGAGRVACGLACGLDRAGLDVRAVSSRTRVHAEEAAARLSHAAPVASAQEVADRTDLVFLTVPDDAIGAVCADIRWQPSHLVVHCSGATEVAALDTARASGAQVGGFHPLQMFADPIVALDRLPGCTIAISCRSDCKPRAVSTRRRRGKAMLPQRGGAELVARVAEPR